MQRIDLLLSKCYISEKTLAVYLQERIEESGKGAEHKVYHRYKGDVHDLASLIICKAEWSHWWFCIRHSRVVAAFRKMHGGSPH